jgi:acyl carrier protein
VSAAEVTTSLFDTFEQAVVEVMGSLPDGANVDSDIKALGIDSLTMIEIVMVVEELLGIDVSQDDFGGVTTVGDALAVFAAAAPAG